MTFGTTFVYFETRIEFRNFLLFLIYVLGYRRTSNFVDDHKCSFIIVVATQNFYRLSSTRNIQNISHRLEKGAHFF